MGTINYKTSEFLTVGLMPFDFDEEKAALIEMGEEDTPEPTDSEVFDYIFDIEAEERAEVEYHFKDLSFSIFDVKIEPGYYEGFSIDVRLDYLYFDDNEEKEAAIKEAGMIRDLWLYAVNNTNCFEVWPGWVTTYKEYDETLESIEKAYKAMLEAVEKIPVDDIPF